MTLPATDWPMLPLSSLGAQVTSGSRGWAKYYAKHGDLFVRITNLTREHIQLDLTDCRYVRINPDEAEAVRTQLATGDLLVSITADIGIIGFIDETVPAPAYINQHIARVRLDGQLADSRFVAYYLASWAPQRRFVGATDTGAKAGMNLTAVAALQAVVPPVEEQCAIADALADADALIHSLGRLLVKKQDIRQGIAQQLLTGQVRLPGFSHPWDDVHMGDVAIIDPESLPANTPADTMLQYISLEDVSRGTIVGSTTVTFADAPSRARRVLAKGDVLFGTVRPNLLSHGLYAGGLERPIASTGFAVVRPRPPRADSRFLLYFILSRLAGRQIDRIIAGSNYPAVTSKDVRNLAIEMPPIAEQTAIATVLADADAEIDALKRRLQKAKALKEGVAQQLLTGRVRLPDLEAVV